MQSLLLSRHNKTTFRKHLRTSLCCRRTRNLQNSEGQRSAVGLDAALISTVYGRTEHQSQTRSWMSYTSTRPRPGSSPLNKGLGSGRMASIAEQEVEDEEEDVGEKNGWRGARSRSSEPHFLLRGSMPAAPCMSLSIGHEPARLNAWKSAAVAP
ncbi:Uncharacterized protein DAT39_022826 [Clarias magur]|uniref:Uncharacterized protein n=1 Tax=Clarias magur TaxID=1594786 RepID=A0A8J4X7N2_CLAMG|nr:Uncharacterized protein DAT39_022826 [Clarias magur]